MIEALKCALAVLASVSPFIVLAIGHFYQAL